MRSCPACGDNGEQIGDYEGGFFVFECLACGMRYLDAPGVSQATFDTYYSQGNTSPDLMGDDSLARLKDLAEHVATYPNCGRILDIGGEYSALRFFLRGCVAMGPGRAINGEYDLVILSHTLEHVYDVDALIADAFEHTRQGGRILIEIPLWKDYEDMAYDFHWQHVNKFRPGDVERLLERVGYADVVGTNLPPFMEYECYRVEGVKP